MTSKALGELCDVRIGRTPRRDSRQFWNGDFPWVTISELDGSLITRSKEGITQLAIETVMPPPVPAGTLLFSFKLSIGKMAVAGVPLHTNEAIAALVIRDFDELDRDYLRFALMATSTGDGANHAVLGKVLNKAKVEALQIPLLPLEEQRHLVDLLSRAEGIVRLRREAQRKAAELVPALFLEMFGDPASNPKGWQMYRIDELLERFEGGKNLQAGDDESATYRILKISAVTSGRYIESESKPAPNDLIPAQSHFVRTGDLLISRANTEALVGATAIVDRTDGRTLLPDKLWRFVWRSDTAIEPKFALHLFQQPAIRNKLSQLASGTGGSMKNISQAKLKTLELPVPPIELQRQFAAKADAVRGIAAQQAAALATAQATFDALLHQSFAVS